MGLTFSPKISRYSVFDSRVHRMAREKSFDCFAVFEIRPIRRSGNIEISQVSRSVLPQVVFAAPRGSRTTPLSRR